ncbi:hypothetical protein KEN51_CDS0404 [Pseudomonas phage vB_Pae10145-KEN51]|nr:hypothetical protein [Pseudomonas phage ANB1]WRQ05843.1 hypothetical protein IPCDMZAV_CDS0320 [Pseudomonas phage 6B]WRQ06340.1 hypothetical protein QAMIJHJT_CDS0409 [Pseudomonas phage 9-Ps-8B]WRQ06748.1 hypothetical protein FOPPYZMZ_CDS0408 [Pseudomonas phage 9Ps-7B]WRQ07099.1 hypothetical protein ZBUARNPM_CDS0350 [Pseudomonas phage 14Ps5-6]
MYYLIFEKFITLIDCISLIYLFSSKKKII